MKSCLEDWGIVTQNGSIKLCSSTEGNVVVCCRKPFQIAKTVCNSWKSYWRNNEGKCIIHTPLIVEGVEANVGQFPELAIVGAGNSRRIRWQCGGTLISPHYVLTAAQCVLRFEPYAVRVGEHHLLEVESGTAIRVVGPVPPGIYGERDLHLEPRNETSIEQFEPVSQIIIHPDYDGRYNDIALLRLEQPVILTNRVLPACLPTNPEEDYSSQNLNVAGWGRINFESHQMSATLLKTTLPVIPRIKCWEDLISLNPQLVPSGVTQQLICAGAPGKDPCKGDSGGPLLYQTKEGSGSACEHTLVGILSFGGGCGKLGVYTRVASFLDWITGYIAPGVVPP